MITALWLLAVQGVIGAFDTVYYHEWRARLPARGRTVAAELRLHAARDAFYAVLFASLPLVEWRGAWAYVLIGVIVAEIVLTLWDFVVEAVVRKPFGDVYAGERVTHAVMGILYGYMIAHLLPSITAWMAMPTALVPTEVAVPPLLKAALIVMAAGVAASGLRDLYASFEGPSSEWPWQRT